MFIDTMVYMFDLTNLRLSHGYPKHFQSMFNIDPNNVHTVFNSYSGKTYIFHNDNLYREIDECTLNSKTWGYISDLFPGIPAKIDSAFRYKDGHMYFFKNNTVFVFNEFTNELVKTERNDLALFGLTCANDDILFQLKELISKLIIQRSN